MVPTMVSAIGTHYPCGSFIKEIIVIPNLLCWDRYGFSCLNVSKNHFANGDKRDANIVNLFCFTLRDVILEWGETHVAFFLSWKLHFLSDITPSKMMNMFTWLLSH
jgi:hypothetical protein